MTFTVIYCVAIRTVGPCGLHPRGKILVKILLSNLLPRRLLSVCRACCARVYMCALPMYWCSQLAKFSAE
jgi:hypothetical protein